jgi:hypothetical protein
MADRQFAEAGTQHDQDPGKADEDSCPTLPANVFLEEDDGEDGDEGRQQEQQAEGFGHRQQGEGDDRGDGADGAADEAQQPQRAVRRANDIEPAESSLALMKGRAAVPNSAPMKAIS